MLNEQIILLEEIFEPSELPPGYYAAYSDSDAYPILYGMTLTEEAEDEGCRYLEGGVVQILASVGIEPIEENVKERKHREGVIKMKHSAFTKVTRDYGNWREMWWREVIQNSIDAGATKVDCKAVEQPDGTWLISCHDNGHGMDLHTIENVFFALGETEKWGRVSHGGFGEAKKLIALAWIKFRVLSKDVEVSGSGSTFPKLDVYEGGEEITGTLVEVVMPADKHTHAAAAVAFIQKCHLPHVQFVVNDEVVVADLGSGEFKRDLPLNSKLFFNRNIDLHAVLVRSNGLYMFDFSLPSDFKGTIFVEVTPKTDYPKPEDLFISSRMGFEWNDLRTTVNDVVSKAAADIKQALREPDALLRQKYEGSGIFTTARVREREAIMREITGPLPDADPGKMLEMPKEVVNDIVDTLKDIKKQDLAEAGGDESKLVAATDPDVAKIMLESPVKGESHLEASVAQLVWKPDFININDESVREGFELDKKFEPATMTAKTYALARLWASFIRFILMKMGSRTEWGTGFLFSEEAQGMYYRGEEGKWIVLNPYNYRTGKLFSIRDEADVRSIFETAIHECAHVIDGGDYHGESFAIMMDTIVVEMLLHWKEAKRIAKKTKVKGMVIPKKVKKPRVKKDVNCYARPFSEDPQSMSIKPLGKALKKISTNLYVAPKQLVTFLYGKQFTDFLELQQVGTQKKLRDGRSAEFQIPVRKLNKIFQEAFDEKAKIYPDDTGFMIPLRIWIRSDGEVAIRPADVRNIRYYTPRWDITPVGTVLMPGSGPEDYIETFFTYNKFLNRWPYYAGPDELARKFLDGKEVIIPVESEIYEKALIHIYDVQKEQVFGLRSKIEVDMEWDDNDKILSLSPYWTGDQVYYTKQYALPEDEYFRISISDKDEIKFILENTGITSYEKRDLLKEQKILRIEIDRLFFEKVLEYHLAEMIIEEEGEVMKEETDIDIGTEHTEVDIYSYGGMNINVLKVLPTFSATVSAYKQKYNIPEEVPVEVFAYANEKNEILGALDLTETDHIYLNMNRGRITEAQIPASLLSNLVSKTFGDVDPVNPDQVGFMPVNLKYANDAEALYIAPVDPRQVKSFRSQGLKTTDIVVKVTNPQGISHVGNKILSDTYTGDELVVELLMRVYDGESILGIITPAYYLTLIETSD
jgi:hypothetical protein